MAARRGNAETVSILVKAGADANAKNDDGLTPLDLAKEKRYTATVKILEEATK